MVERVPSRNVPSAIHNNSASAVDQDLREAQALLSAKESEEMGLVSKVVNSNEIYEEASVLAGKIAKNAPLAVQASKRMMRMGLNENFDDHVHHVFLQLLPLFQSEDFKEGMLSFMEKRDPDFKGQ